MLDALYKWLDSKQASEIAVYAATDLCDYIISCTALNRTHASALTAGLRYELKHKFNIIPEITGGEENNWVLVDAQDIIINIFVSEVRFYYQLDALLEQHYTVVTSPLTQSYKDKDRRPDHNEEGPLVL